jgi:hypothetical protein
MPSTPSEVILCLCVAFSLGVAIGWALGALYGRW